MCCLTHKKKEKKTPLEVKCLRSVLALCIRLDSYHIFQMLLAHNKLLDKLGVGTQACCADIM